MRESGLVQNRVRVHKPDAQAKDTALCQGTSRNKRRREWFESLKPSLARQACRFESLEPSLARQACRFVSSPDVTAGDSGSRVSLLRRSNQAAARSRLERLLWPPAPRASRSARVWRSGR